MLERVQQKVSSKEMALQKVSSNERVQQKVSSNEMVLQKMKEVVEKGNDEEALQKWSNKENVKMISGAKEKTYENALQKFATDTTGKEYITRLGKRSIFMKTRPRRSGY